MARQLKVLVAKGHQFFFSTRIPAQDDSQPRVVPRVPEMSNWTVLRVKSRVARPVRADLGDVCATSTIHLTIRVTHGMGLPAVG